MSMNRSSSMQGFSMQNEPSDLDLWPLNPKTVSLLGYPKMIPYTKFEHFGIIHFEISK